MGVISKISEESARRKISIGLGVKTINRVLSAHLGFLRYANSPSYSRVEIQIATSGVATNQATSGR